MPPAQEYLNGPPRGSKPRRVRPAGSRGFTYLGLLFFVAISAAALAALGTRWSTAVQREKERELEFRGREIARAIANYLRAGQGLPSSVTASTQDLSGSGTAVLPRSRYPRSLEDLLRDERGPQARHHLRRAYVDPFTGRADWVLVPAPEDPQGFQAVHSRSEQPLFKRLSDSGEQELRALDWVFSAADAQAAESASAPASAASAAKP